MDPMEKYPLANADRGGPSIRDAVAEIGVIQQRIMATGAVDTEPNDLLKLAADVQGGKMLPAEAVMKARAIEEGRQSYH